MMVVRRGLCFVLTALSLLLGGALSTFPAADVTGHVSTVVPGRGPGSSAAPYDAMGHPAGHVQRAFTWEHAGRPWHLNVSIDQNLLDAYAARDRLPYDHDYAAYVLDSRDDPWVRTLAFDLDRMYSAAGLQGKAKLDAILAFVQHLPYSLDKETTPYSEWPRYPAETLRADATDCEDTVILYVSILRALGHDAVLLSPPRHMAAGVALDGEPSGTFVEHDGKRYYYAETTGAKWRIGKLPDRFEGQEIRVLDLEPQAILSRPTWSVESLGDTLQVTIIAYNVGDLPARDVTLGARIQAIGGKTWHRGECAAVDVAAESTVTCVVLLNTPPAQSEPRLHAWAKSPDASGRTDSAPLVL